MTSDESFKELQEDNIGRRLPRSRAEGQEGG
jgi:hypothetical protein